MTRFKFAKPASHSVVWNPVPVEIMSGPDLAALGGCLDALADVPADRRLAAVARFCRVFLDHVADKKVETLDVLIKAIEGV